MSLMEWNKGPFIRTVSIDGVSGAPGLRFSKVAPVVDAEGRVFCIPLPGPRSHLSKEGTRVFDNFHLT